MKTITIPTPVSNVLQELKRYRVLIFVVIVALSYGYMVFTINQATSAEPDSSDATPTQTAHVNPDVVKQLQQLQDNSVSVQSLFNQARENPFQ